MIIDFGMDVYRIESHDRECLWQSSVIDIRTIIQKSCSNLTYSLETRVVRRRKQKMPHSLPFKKVP